MNIFNSDLFIAPRGGFEKMRKADSLDREWLSEKIRGGDWGKVILNDEKLEDGGILLTVSYSAWKELDRLV